MGGPKAEAIAQVAPKYPKKIPRSFRGTRSAITISESERIPEARTMKTGQNQYLSLLLLIDRTKLEREERSKATHHQLQSLAHFSKQSA